MTCETCKHWEDRDTHFTNNELSKGFGECVLYPPKLFAKFTKVGVVTATVIISRFPSIRKDMTCGQHEKRL